MLQVGGHARSGASRMPRPVKILSDNLARTRPACVLHHTTPGMCVDCPEREWRERKMAAEQDKGIGTGRVPGLNTERIYTTTVPASELAQALADHFRAQGFETQVFRTSGDRTAMQARKESLWRTL